MERSSITSNYNFSRIKQNSDDVDCFHKNTRRPIYNFYCIYCKRNAIYTSHNITEVLQVFDNERVSSHRLIG